MPQGWPGASESIVPGLNHPPPLWISLWATQLGVAKTHGFAGSALVCRNLRQQNSFENQALATH
jgi:hypothetical protein